MSWTCEIALRASSDGDADAVRDSRVAAQTWFVAGPRQALSALAGLASFDLYTPAQGPSHDPYNHDGAGPAMMLMLDFADRAQLAAAVTSGAIAAALGTLPVGIAVTGAAFERRFYPVGDDPRPAPLEAPFSYVVRYHRPADDEAAFIRNYLDTHPVTQARLPAIRSIMCYLPLDDLRVTDLATANYMIGNEVVFDDIAAFNGAMASPVRQELREHYHEFPRFTGANTHFPMTRTRLVG
ncbi:MAG: hypothetical protein GC182_13155 [Rhodopseudomonas sp.]|nr:hypothetical protein [Rhodopseudomonas sp.]